MVRKERKKKGLAGTKPREKLGDISNQSPPGAKGTDDETTSWVRKLQVKSNDDFERLKKDGKVV